MKLTIDPKILKNELAFLNVVVDKKGTDVFSYVLIESIDKESVSIKASNMETSIKTTVEATVEEEGSMCIQGKKLHDISKVVTKELSLSTDKNSWIIAKSGISKYKVPGLEPSKFPAIALLDKPLIKMHTDTLIKMIKATAFAITTEESRFALAGINLEVLGDTAKAVSTDGHRISCIEGVAKTAKEVTDEIKLLIPKGSLSELNKLPKNEVVDISYNDKLLFFKVNDRYVTTRRLVGQFPNYEVMFNLDDNVEAYINKDEFKESLNRIAFMTDSVVKSVTLNFSKGKLALNANSDSGEVDDSIGLGYKGKDLTMKFNVAYLQDFLANCDEEELVLSFKDLTKPMIISYDDYKYKYAVMPLRG